MAWDGGGPLEHQASHNRPGRLGMCVEEVGVGGLGLQEEVWERLKS